MTSVDRIISAKRVIERLALFEILPANRDDNKDGGMIMITYAKLPYHHDNHDRSRRRRTNRRGEKRRKLHSCVLSRPSSHHSRIFFTLLSSPPLISPPPPPADFPPRRSPEESTSSHRLTCIDTRHATRKRSGQRLIKLVARHATLTARREPPSRHLRAPLETVRQYATIVNSLSWAHSTFPTLFVQTSLTHDSEPSVISSASRVRPVSLSAWTKRISADSFRVATECHFLAGLIES